jgi:hypothetical protein
VCVGLAGRLQRQKKKKSLIFECSQRFRSLFNLAKVMTPNKQVCKSFPLVFPFSPLVFSSYFPLVFSSCTLHSFSFRIPNFQQMCMYSVSSVTCNNIFLFFIFIYFFNYFYCYFYFYYFYFYYFIFIFIFILFLLSVYVRKPKVSVPLQYQGIHLPHSNHRFGLLTDGVLYFYLFYNIFFSKLIKIQSII